jgi:hypothetical protein
VSPLVALLSSVALTPPHWSCCSGYSGSCAAASGAATSLISASRPWAPSPPCCRGRQIFRRPHATATEFAGRRRLLGGVRNDAAESGVRASKVPGAIHWRDSGVTRD